MKVTVNKAIVPWKLGRELIAAGVTHQGMSLCGRDLEILVSDERQEPLVQPVVDAHDGIDTIDVRETASRTIAKNIPNWATWSQQEWATWRDANISSTQISAIANLTDAKALLAKMAIVLDNLAKMEIAMRDQIWPDLPEN